MKNTWKSIGAVISGLVFIFISHTGTDAILENAGILPKGHLFVGTGLILAVILYRSVFSLAGCYLAARLAPQNPMRHSLILGFIGVVLSIMGAIVNAQMNLGPQWYPWTLVATSVPIAWLAGKLYESRSKSM